MAEFLPHPGHRIRIRRVDEPQKLAPLHALEQQVYPFPWSARIFHDCLGSGYDILSYHDREGLVGYSVWMAVVDEIHLLNLCVAPGWQGQGVGRAAIEHVQQTLAPRNLRGMLLEVRVSNLAALNLYARCGFVEIGRRRGYYPAGQQGREDAIVMRYEPLGQA